MPQTFFQDLKSLNLATLCRLSTWAMKKSGTSRTIEQPPPTEEHTDRRCSTLNFRAQVFVARFQSNAE